MQRARKAQERTAITRDRLLSAAEEAFAQRGYEKAQLAEIAEAAGFSKGALYAHFKSKEELFFALAKEKATGYQAKLRHAVESAPTREAKIAAFRSFYVQLSADKKWAVIILEVKLFVTRHPNVKDRLRRAEEELEDGVEGAFIKLFGKSAWAAGKALGGIFSALVLEADLEANVLTERKMRAMLAAIFDTLAGFHNKAQDPIKRILQHTGRRSSKRESAERGTSSAAQPATAGRTRGGKRVREKPKGALPVLKKPRTHPGPEKRGETPRRPSKGTPRDAAN